MPPNVYFGIGVCYYKLGKFEKAKKAFEMLVKYGEGEKGNLGLAMLSLNNSLDMEEMMKGFDYLGLSPDLRSPLYILRLAEYY